mmetsp:Transcript_28264/g.100327  ORF Transcript_28264/g.100327 Transcript_28264/m.100327 type:complete len:288 (+) Transcript_28264:738-1601(+)
MYARLAGATWPPRDARTASGHLLQSAGRRPPGQYIDEDPVTPPGDEWVVLQRHTGWQRTVHGAVLDHGADEAPLRPPNQDGKPALRHPHFEQQRSFDVDAATFWDVVHDGGASSKARRPSTASASSSLVDDDDAARPKMSQRLRPAALPATTFSSAFHLAALDGVRDPLSCPRRRTRFHDAPLTSFDDGARPQGGGVDVNDDVGALRLARERRVRCTAARTSRHVDVAALVRAARRGTEPRLAPPRARDEAAIGGQAGFLRSTSSAHQRSVAQSPNAAKAPPRFPRY